MTKKEQTLVINELIRNVKKEIQGKAKKFPKEWDGIELRWFIADAFKGVVFGGTYNKKHKRFKDFNNECICNNWYL